MNYSVLMSVYAKDNPNYLKIAIESMLNQTIRPEQYVIVQDGPLGEQLTDILQNYKAQMPELFTLVILEQNGGLGKALDAGLQYCRNELVARMDADDISLPERCEKELELFAEHPQLSICSTNIDEFYEEPDKIHTIRRVPSEYEAIKKMIKRRQPFNHPAVMFKKSEVVRCGGYGALKRKQDYDLFSRMLNMGCYALNIDESLLKFRADRDNYKRRKSREYVKSSISVGWLNYRRGYCGMTDLLYIVCGQLALYIMPLKLMTFVSDSLLREKADETVRMCKTQTEKIGTEE